MTIKNYTAASEIPAHRIFKFAAKDSHIELATAKTDTLMGVTDNLNVKVGDIVDAHLGGIVDVEYGGTIVAGEPLTADNVGRAVKAQGADKIVGYALISGIVDVIGSMVINR